MRVHELLDHWVSRKPDEVYVSDGERSLTWREMHDWSLRVGNWLAGRLEPGDRFCLLDRNSLEMIAVYFGASRAGVVPVPLNFRLAPREWAYIATDAGVRLALVGTDYVEAFADAVPGTAVSPIGIGGGRGLRFAPEVRDTAATAVDREISYGAVYHQMYTSGTTGKPKGAMVTHRAATTHAMQLQLALGSVEKTTLCVMPLFHAGAALQVLSYTSGGCSIRVVRDFDRATVMRLMSDLRVQLLTLAPAMIGDMIADPLASELDFSSLELLVYGSAPMSVEHIRRAMGVFGCDFAQAYGMTETCAVATVLDAADHRRAIEGHPELLASAGRPILGTQVRVVGRDGEALGVGEVGEIVVAGPQLMSGYWGLPDASADALRGGWMHTGDAGYLGSQGHVHISDRVKDMIISGGENIYPREVEEVIFGLGGVADVAVIGVPSARWGESPVAIIVPSGDDTAAGSLSEDAVLEHCRANLARFKCPISVTFVDALPRSAVGKILKRELRAPYWKDQPRNIS